MKIFYFAVVFSTWVDTAVALLALYLFLVFFKKGQRCREEARVFFLYLALAVIPLLAIVHFGGRWDFSRGSDFNSLDCWWSIQVQPEGDDGEAGVFNLIKAGLVFSMLFIGAGILVGLFSWYHRKKRGVRLLSIHRLLIKMAILLLGMMFYLKSEGISLTPLWVGMGAASIVLGIALQEPLASLFTGVALDLEGVFRRGEWIRVGGKEGLAGKVVEKNWRTTRIMTIDDELVTLPNKTLGSEKVLNYNQPDAAHVHKLYVGTSYNDPPVKVKEILRTLLIREPRIATDPSPRVRTIKYNDFSVDYQLKFWIRNYEQHPDINDSIMTQIWYAFKFYGVEIPFPIRTVHMKEREQVAQEGTEIDGGVDRIRGFLDALPFLDRHLNHKDLDYLARNSFQRPYKAGEHVVHKGEKGDALYIVSEGWCEVMLSDGRSRKIEQGGYFGEMGLMGGRLRTADVVAGAEGGKTIRVDRESMQVLFNRYPRLQEEFEQVKQQRIIDSRLEKEQVGEEEVSLVAKILKEVREFIVPW